MEKGKIWWFCERMERTVIFLSSLLVLSLSITGCRETVKPPAKDIVQEKEAWEERTAKNLKEHLLYAAENQGKLNDSLSIVNTKTIGNFYKDRNYELVWSVRGGMKYAGNGLFEFIRGSTQYGLFPEDYAFSRLEKIRTTIATNPNSESDATLWVQNDLLLTDAFVALSKHLKQGRLPYDTVTLRKDTVLSDTFYMDLLKQAIVKNEVKQLFHDLQPKHPGYDSLINYLPSFLDSARFVSYTKLKYPYKDSSAFYTQLYQRLLEDSLVPVSGTIDTAILSRTISDYQKKRGLKVTGKPNDALVKSLNFTDLEKFKRIAINLDRFKLLPDTLPLTYIWVNLPGFYLKVWDSGSVAFESRVIVGAPKTRTPVLTSDITNFITFPQWTVPYSIIFKEMLPQIQKNVGYLDKQNLMVVDKNDSVVDPHTIEWNKLSKTNFPYLLKQRQGDDNSLGIIKFNFRNKYSVYLHDTNARWLFSKTQRALSHGCVRVQSWQKMADFLIRNNHEKIPPDSLKSWLKRQEKKVVSGFPKVPVFIRYFTCDGTDGKVKFYEDIYGDDQLLINKYFANKIL